MDIFTTEPKQIVGVGDSLTVRRGSLVTHALGSCLGLVVWDPAIRVGGLLHAMLPLAQINPDKSERNPSMFVETGVPALLKSVISRGARKSDLIIKAAGCANPLKSGTMFRVGERNLEVLERLLAKNDLCLHAADTGGTRSRTMHVDVSTGQVVISSGRRRWEL